METIDLYDNDIGAAKHLQAEESGCVPRYLERNDKIFATYGSFIGQLMEALVRTP